MKHEWESLGYEVLRCKKCGKYTDEEELYYSIFLEEEVEDVCGLSPTGRRHNT